MNLRLLDAATQLFLKRGFKVTSCDQIATLADAGKGSRYARYANKEELFTAVVRRSVEASLRPSNDSLSELPLMERLRIVGLDILHHSLQPDAVAMMRMVIATATRFAELAQLANRIGWEGGVERVAEVISARAQPDSLSRARPAAAWFISLTFAPQQMRAMFGENSHTLQVAARVRVDEAIKMLAQGGWLDGWEYIAQRSSLNLSGSKQRRASKPKALVGQPSRCTHQTELVPTCRVMSGGRNVVSTSYAARSGASGSHK